MELLIRKGEKGNGRFELEGHKLATVSNSPYYYMAWYEKRLGYDRRVSLGTPDRTAAVTLIAEYVLQGGLWAPDEQEDLEVETAVRLYLAEPRHRGKWGGHGQQLLRALKSTCPEVTIGKFTPRVQIELVKGLETSGRFKDRIGVGTINQAMMLLGTAIRWACKPNLDLKVLCTREPGPIITGVNAIAEILDTVPPEPRNWHPTTDELGLFLSLIGTEEALRRWCVLALAFACRPEAAARATAIQYDARKDTFALNPAGRRQTRGKYRPTLPMPPSLLAEVRTWPEEIWIEDRTRALRDRFARIGLPLGLGPDFVLSCLRDYMATALREAYVTYGVPFVPKEQREMWMGHRHPGINKLYGQFTPTYLLLARNAVECVLHDLDRRSGGVLLRGARAAGTLPEGPVVIDPAALRGSGFGALGSGKSGNSGEADSGEEVSPICFGGSPPRPSLHRTAWNRAVVLRPRREIAGKFEVTEENFRQISAKPGHKKKAISAPTLLKRMEESGFRVFEYIGKNEKGETQSCLFVSAISIQILSDRESEMLTRIGTKWYLEANKRGET